VMGMMRSARIKSGVPRGSLLTKKLKEFSSRVPLDRTPGGKKERKRGYEELFYGGICARKLRKEVFKRREERRGELQKLCALKKGFRCFGIRCSAGAVLLRRRRNHMLGNRREPRVGKRPTGWLVNHIGGIKNNRLRPRFGKEKKGTGLLEVL